MGGLIILTGLLISVLMWGNLKNIYVVFALYIAISFGLLGAYDDYKKIKFKSSSGISSKLKISIQIIWLKTYVKKNIKINSDNENLLQ